MELAVKNYVTILLLKMSEWYDSQKKPKGRKLTSKEEQPVLLQSNRVVLVVPIYIIEVA